MTASAASIWIWTWWRNRQTHVQVLSVRSRSKDQELGHIFVSQRFPREKHFCGRVCKGIKAARDFIPWGLRWFRSKPVRNQWSHIGTAADTPDSRKCYDLAYGSGGRDLQNDWIFRGFWLGTAMLQSKRWLLHYRWQIRCYLISLIRPALL